MLQIGDKVVYPMHGAGIITGVEECDFQGQNESFFVLKMLLGSMKVMVPVDRAEAGCLRKVIPASKLSAVEEVLLGKPERLEGTWNKRFLAIQDRMKSGDIADVAAVFRNLFLQDRYRKISSGERRLLDLSRRILVSEIIYACDNTQEETEKWLDSVIKENQG